jgi:hypothetical protein
MHWSRKGKMASDQRLNPGSGFAAVSHRNNMSKSSSPSLSGRTPSPQMTKSKLPYNAVDLVIEDLDANAGGEQLKGETAVVSRPGNRVH